MPKLGEAIPLTEANQLIKQRIKITTTCNLFIDGSIEKNRKVLEKISTDEPPESPFFNFFQKVENSYSDGANAYVFSKDDFLRFFDGDSNAETGGTGKADFIMILVGAHSVDSSPYSKGNQAIMIAGCNRESADSTIYTTMKDWKMPVTEHPPMKVVENVPVKLADSDFIQITFE